MTPERKKAVFKDCLKQFALTFILFFLNMAVIMVVFFLYALNVAAGSAQSGFLYGDPVIQPDQVCPDREFTGPLVGKVTVNHRYRRFLLPGNDQEIGIGKPWKQSVFRQRLTDCPLIKQREPETVEVFSSPAGLSPAREPAV